MTVKLIAYHADGTSVNIRLDVATVNSAIKHSDYLFATHPHVVATSIIKGE